MLLPQKKSGLDVAAMRDVEYKTTEVLLSRFEMKLFRTWCLVRENDNFTPKRSSDAPRTRKKKNRW